MDNSKCQSCRWFDPDLWDGCQLNFAVRENCQVRDFYRWEPPISSLDDKEIDKLLEEEG